MPFVSKKQKAVKEIVDRTRLYTVSDALSALAQCPSAKFDESVEISINLNVDTRHADQMVRSSVLLPHGTGKKVRVAVFAKGDAVKEAEKAGADVVGADDLVKKIEGGFMDFDRVVATPDCMPLVGRLGKILGPRGLMPNPKMGTVTPNVAKAVADIKAGQVEFKAEKNGIVHALVGKKSFDSKKLEENVMAFVAAVKAAKPSGAKGIYMKSAAISSTMGPGIKLDIASFK